MKLEWFGPAADAPAAAQPMPLRWVWSPTAFRNRRATRLACRIASPAPAPLHIRPAPHGPRCTPT